MAACRRGTAPTRRSSPPPSKLGIALQEAEIQAIANNPAAPTFDNTIGALQNAGRHLDRASLVFAVMTDNVATPAVQAVEAEWSPRLTTANNAIIFNRGLFQRIDTLYGQRATLGLNAEQLRLLERTRDQFVRAGAALTDQQQARVGAINDELSTKFADFGRRLLADENTAIFIQRRADLAGLPRQHASKLYAAAATERGHPGQWAVVNTRSSVDPFLTFSSNRRLRQQVFTAFKNRGDNGDANDTNAVIADIVRLRSERAQILGFPTHAHFRMADTMAQDPARAQDLMMRVWPAAVARVAGRSARHAGDRRPPARAHHHRAVGLSILRRASAPRRATTSIRTRCRPYFELNNMINASLWMANQLYGLSFREITGTVPVFHPDVRVWEVTGRDGSYVGLFYGDYFARAGKRSGAWAQGYQGHETFNGTTVTPITSNNNNFVRGAEGQPVLISLDDARNAVPRIRPRLHGLVEPGELSRPRRHAARLRRISRAKCTNIGC